MLSSTEQSQLQSIASLRTVSRSHTIKTNGIKLHYLEFAGDKPTVILMHGLTANAHAFDGLMAEGLSPALNVISVDLRGRGESDQPESYNLADHAADIIGMLDKLQIQKAIIGGHSFGGLLTFYLAKHFPDRIDKMLLMDAAARMHENTKEMLGPALSRLGQTFPSFDYYIDKVKAAPYLDFWAYEMLSYYKADVRKNEDGTVTCIPQPMHMAMAVDGVLAEPIIEYIQTVEQPAILINGSGTYTMGAALLPKENAVETANMMKNCKYVEVPGNHQTMLFGDGAKA
ncbi:MAG: alpha/beta hydrolase, partial [Segetibacter sp.]